MSDTNAEACPADFAFSISQDQYRHISLDVDDDLAFITLNVDSAKGLRSDTLLKLNSYDLAVDIELADAINRLRFEHPQVRVVTIKSGHPQVFSSGANIYMLKKSSHAFKVNFCKFTNETRLYMEEASNYSGKKFLCALNGTAAGGGYELALACDRIVLLDDKNANVSLPEVPLLGVLPGTGGLTRLTDKRKIRRDVADVFCTVAEGIKGHKAKDYGLVDEIYAKSQWSEGLKTEIEHLKGRSEERPARGITLTPITATKKPSGFSYTHVDVELTPERVAKIVVKAPDQEEPSNLSAMLERGQELWLIKAFRELDDAILRLRFFHREHGLWQLHTRGDMSLVLSAEKALYDAMAQGASWFLREILLHIGRVYRRIDVSSRSIVAVIDQQACYAGVLAEILMMADRSYALMGSVGGVSLSPINNGLLPTWNNSSRLCLRFLGAPEQLELLSKKCDGSIMTLPQAYDFGLITFLLDDIDFEDEFRVFRQERASLSPDALSAMEANLRFSGQETLASKIFGRLSAWQNWVFTRDNATGARGALTSYGEDLRPEFNWERC